MTKHAMPCGAQYYSESYGIRSYYRKMAYAIGPESGKPLMAWFYWDGAKWVKDSGINTDRLIAIC